MTNSTHSFGENAVIEELKKRGFNVTFGYKKEYRGILVNGLKVETKSCNYDNQWAQKKDLLGGWDRINPEKFDYLICVTFDNAFENVRYLIFSKKETELFLKIFWKNDETSNLRNLTLKNEEKETDELVKLSENRWDKITEYST